MATTLHPPPFVLFCPSDEVEGLAGEVERLVGEVERLADEVEGPTNEVGPGGLEVDAGKLEPRQLLSLEAPTTTTLDAPPERNSTFSQGLFRQLERC
jgi:hypothetical protein